MTKEQEKTIERLNRIITTKFNNDYSIDSSDKEAIETVLSMLKEKDRQINSKNGTINALQCALKERTEERDRKDNIITKQKKIIDLMAEKIHQLGSDYDDFCIDIVWNEDCDEDCKECIKQYFERKSEEC